MALGRGTWYTGAGRWATILRRNDPRMTAHPKEDQDGPPAKPKPSPEHRLPQGKRTKRRDKHQLGREAQERHGILTMCSPRSPVSSKGRGKPELFQSYLPTVPPTWTHEQAKFIEMGGHIRYWAQKWGLGLPIEAGHGGIAVALKLETGPLKSASSLLFLGHPP